MIHTKEIKEGTLTFRKLANDLRKELLKSTTPRAGRTIAKGAFGPSFANLDNTEPKEDKQEKRGRSKRKMTTRESLAKCPTCEF
jgi:hypothetical protein